MGFFRCVDWAANPGDMIRCFCGFLVSLGKSRGLGTTLQNGDAVALLESNLARCYHFAIQKDLVLERLDCLLPRYSLGVSVY